MASHFKSLILSDYQVNSFYHALRTKGFVILAGLSGTGKTKIFEEICIETNTLFDQVSKARKEFKLDNLENMQLSDWHAGRGKGLLNLIANPGSSSVFNKNNKSKDRNDNFFDLYDFCNCYNSSYIRNKEKNGEEYIREQDLLKHCYLLKKYVENDNWLKKDDKKTLDEKAAKGAFEIVKEKLSEIEKKSRSYEPLGSIKEDIFSKHFIKLFMFIYAPCRFEEIFNEEIEKLKNFLLSKEYCKKLFFPIRPDFKDSKSLLGYYNPLSEVYQSTKLLDFILASQKEYITYGQNASPYLVLFDEMNLARVEYFFADFLSVLESKRVQEVSDVDDELLKYVKDNEGKDVSKDRLIGFFSKPILLHNENNASIEIPQKLYLSPNLYFVGTVNIDETTYMFSPKVLDRAFIIEFDSDIDMYFERINSDTRKDIIHFCLLDFTRNGKFAIIQKNLVQKMVEKKLSDYSKTYREILTDIFSILRPHGLHFGYRVCDEIMMFMYNATVETRYRMEKHFETLDLAIKMKILPKFYGAKQKLEKPIKEFIKYCVSLEKSESNNETSEYFNPQSIPLLKKTDEGVLKVSLDGKDYEFKFPHTARKLIEMLYKLQTQGFASFM